MIKILTPLVFLFIFSSFLIAQKTCAENAKIVQPVLSETARKTYETKLAEAETDFKKSPTADTYIWLGRRTAYPGDYKKAIKIFTDAVAKFPNDARLYRHRGHRFLTIRCFDDAIKDLKKAEELIRQYAIRDEIEPDGLPNERNIPTSSLWSNIYYHLGLAYYLKGNYDDATAAFMASFNNSKSDDMRVASAHWVYMSSQRYALKKKDKNSEKDLKRFINVEIKDNLDIIESGDYYKLVKLYQGKLKPEDLTTTDANTLSNASLGYGLGNWFLYNGEKEKAAKIFRQITSGNQWASFGFIAAESELSSQ